MKCLRCGYCCIEYMVMIVDKPELGLVESNVKFKPSGVRCPHLQGDKPGEHSCAIHDQPWYNQTPCADFGQIESSPEDACRMGEYLLIRDREL